ncbi:MAG: hypothetical protein JWO47_1047 [Candidatus Saccharibacteria bacterium]|nr:hypothetical protein [Candidatus Saccharibacteria bacterium]
MSAEQAPQTQTLERPIEPQLIHWSSDYATQKAYGINKVYTEAEIIHNPDGGMQFKLATAQIDNPSSTLPPIESAAIGEGTLTFENNLSLDAMSFEQSYTKNDIAQKVLNKLGFRYRITTHDNVNFSELVTPGTERLNTIMVYLEKETGFAPSYKDFLGGHFPQKLMVEELDQENILIATEPLDRSHDLTAHMFVWATVPEEAFKTCAARGVTLLHTYQKAVGSGTKEEIDAAEAELDGHYNNIENYISGLTFASVADIANEDNINKLEAGTATEPIKKAAHSLEQALSGIMYGKHANREQRDNARGLVLEMPRRLQIIAEMPEEYLVQALAQAA